MGPRKLNKPDTDSAPGGVVDTLITKAWTILDALFPPAQREKWWAKFKDFATSYPKLTGFLLTNIVLSGPPLLLFIVFTVTVFVVSLIAALLIAVISALLFTVFMLLVALFIVLPTVFLTTMAASFVFVWGLGGYYILKWFNDGTTPVAVGNAIGDKLSGVTGGRLDWLMGAAREKQAGGSAEEKDALLGAGGDTKESVSGSVSDVGGKVTGAAGNGQMALKGMTGGAL